jgi:two-component system sensor histidine kinase DegS
MTGPRPSCTRCARAGSRCRRTEVAAHASAAPAGSTPAPQPAEITSAAELAALLTAEAAALHNEVGEIELLINQAKTEATRHEARRTAATEKLGISAERLATGGNVTPKELTELANQLVAVARRAALMEAQVDLLEAKRKSLARLHEAIVTHAQQARSLAGIPNQGRSDASSVASDASPVDEAGPMPPGVSRMILTAQEDLRREIARQMHDGPAQSLTNIVLQAQIVDRLMTKAPDKAPAEVGQLIAMVQRTLDATKTFIFDVRPMVLDDLGLVPTLRRASRDRGSRVGVAVDFESVGVDRRLPPELESGLFRMLDDALAAHVARKPDRLSLHLDWGDRLTVELTAGKNPVPVPDPELPPEGAELPPALAEMVGERRRAYNEALEAARIAALSRLPDQAWRDISSRARILGVTAQMLDDGARLHLEVELPTASEGASVSVGEAAAS